MKRVRGVEDISPPVTAAAPPPSPLRNTNTGGAVAAGSTGGGGVSGGSGGVASGIEYRPSGNIGVVTVGQTVRTVPPPQEMPSSIQFTQTQQQYSGAIVVPSAAPSSVKISGPIGGLPSSTCAPSSVPSNITLHAGISTGNHSNTLQAPVPSSQSQPHAQPSAIRHRTVQASTPPVGNSSGTGGVAGSASAPGGANNSQFQRLKVEDALSYLDQVKFKFSDQPQVYNDFLDIMKEFKSQSIDTPGVISRVSHLFKGHPELIVGFNTFLPPGYKIEVQANEQGYAFQVSVSVPSPTATHTATLSQHHCTVNVGSPPVPNAPTQSAKAQPVVQIMQGSGSIHHPMLNNIVNNHNCLTIHDSSSPIQYNNSHATQAQAQAVSQALSQAQDGVPNTGQTQQNQPVEFNHAINYVNKIKNRFQDQPDKYKRFLEILHTYQKEQRTLKESGYMGGSGSGGSLPGSGKHLTEAEVYSQVAKLFENQEDLLMEFGQFLPDATNQQSALSAMFQTNKVGPVNDHAAIVKKPLGLKTTYNNAGAVPRDSHRDVQGPGGLERDGRDHRERERERERGPSGIKGELGVAAQKFGHTTGQLKRSPSFTTSIPTSNSHQPHGPPPLKKHKVASARDSSIADVGKHGTLNDYAFFDKVRKALRSPEVYENFLRCLVLYNQEVISKTELVQLVSPFLGRFPELFKWFKDFLGHQPDSSTSSSSTVGSHQTSTGSSSNNVNIEALPNNVVRSHQERPQGDLAMEIDYTTCKRLGASYCALPKTYAQPKCSGRTQLCREVLNDTWVSFPTWSEDSTFVTSRKTQFEEFIYRCEDERFELDGVIETNAATIRVLEGVQKKMTRMSPEELQKFKLDDNLGGTSTTIHQRALKRIYGDKAADIIEGLKKNPSVAVSVVLRRLKHKEEEWREAQKGFNKIWREQNEKFYLKSLDHQGINFKQNDVKALRSKSLFNEIECLYEEGHDQADEIGGNQNCVPHLILPYKDKSVLDDAANLLIHHVKRQTAIHKEDKQRIKTLLKHFIPDLFFHPRQELSDDEQDEDSENVNPALCGNNSQTPTTATSVGGGLQGNRNKAATSPTPSSMSVKPDPDVKPPPHALSTDPEEAYTLFMTSNNWYLFLRLHQILCERLTKMYERATVLAEEESRYKQQRSESVAVALRLKPKCDIEVEDYYPAFLDMVKNVLDGNMESTVYEDTLREMFGIHAYIAFTLDKVVTYAIRQLQQLVTDNVCQQCAELFQREQRQPKESCGAGGLCSTAYLRASYEAAYQRKAEKLMAEENCFKVYIYKKNCKMTIELLEADNEETNESSCRDRDRDSVATTEKWSTYVERYSSSTPSQQSPKDVPTSSDNEPPANHPIDGNGWSSLEKVLAGRKRLFLYRNAQRYKKLASLKHSKESAGTVNSEKINDPDGKKSFEAKATEDTDLVLSDETQCVFNNFQITFIVEKNTFLYKKNCLTQAKQSHRTVTKNKFSKFQQWHFKWASKNVVDSQHRLCQDWLMGRYENLVPHRTRVITDNDQTSTPYRQYNRFCIDRLQCDQAADQARSVD